MDIQINTSSITITTTAGKVATYPLGSMIVRKFSETVVHIDCIHTSELFKENIADIIPAMVKNTDTVAPGVTDDTNAGYIVGDIWYNSVGDTYYQATDVTAGAAVWATFLGGVSDVVDDYTRKLVEYMNGTASIFS